MINNISNNLIIGDNDDDYDNNEDEKYKNILNKFKEDDKENDLFYNQINNYNEKPKMLRKNSIDKEKGLNQKKMISFEEFLLKENVNE